MSFLHLSLGLINWSQVYASYQHSHIGCVLQFIWVRGGDILEGGILGVCPLAKRVCPFE